MAITAGMVKALREKTGLPMMECKNALSEADGDEQKAIELLRKKGMAQISKRAGKETAQGRLMCLTDADSGRTVMLEMLCETEPVSGTEDFAKLSEAAINVAVKMETPTAETILEQPLPDDPGRKVGDLLSDVVNRIRENIKIGRVGVLSGHVGKYVHHDGRKGVLIELTGPCPEEAGAGVCMHVAAMRPAWTTREEVDPAMVEEERKVAVEQVKGKPEHLIEKIVAGKMDRWFSEIVLLEQPFVKDDKQSVGEYLRGFSPDLTIRRCLRIEIGE